MMIGQPASSAGSRGGERRTPMPPAAVRPRAASRAPNGGGIIRLLYGLLLVALALAAGVVPGRAQSPPPAAAAVQDSLRAVVIVIRHGVRSPTDPAELTPYAAKPWPAWPVPPGNLTPHGAALVTIQGKSYRKRYAAAGLLPDRGCPSAGSVFVWADPEQRTQATADALLAGIAPHCPVVRHGVDAKTDPLFHALPQLGKADSAASRASVIGTVGGDPSALITANAGAFATLESILGCSTRACARVTDAASEIVTSQKTGLVSVSGPIDLASTAVEDFILEYAEGMPMAEVGWGRLDRQTIESLEQLHMLKYAVNTRTEVAARSQGSDLLAAVAATVDQGAAGAANGHTPVPPQTRFAAFVGHDTNLEELAGILHLTWLVPGYQPDDAPPGGALEFEVHAGSAPGTAFVRTFFSAQTLDQLRSGSSLSDATPLRVPVFVPGCPRLDCPIAVFDSVVTRAVDAAFVDRAVSGHADAAAQRRR